MTIERPPLKKLENDPVDSTTRFSDFYIFNWREFACGSGAAFVNVTVTYPINKLIFRQMLHGSSAKDVIYVMKNEGIFYLYRGMLPPLTQKMLSMSLMFGVYDHIRRPLTEVDINPYAAKFLASMSSGVTEASLTPFERVLTLLADSRYHKEFKNTYHVFTSLWRYGYKEYYRGFIPIIYRNGFRTASFFILKDEFRGVINRNFGEQLTPALKTLSEFFCGAVVGAAVSSFFYPLNVIKVAMQSKVGGKFESIPTVFSQVYHERGRRITGFYHGVVINCGRSFLSWGIINTVYEQFVKILY